MRLRWLPLFPLLYAATFLVVVQEASRTPKPWSRS